jgi:predicted amidohydrolase YtcJ
VATFTEQDLGTLEPGKFGDFVVVDRDLVKSDAEGLRKAKVLVTFVGGEKVN